MIDPYSHSYDCTLTDGTPFRIAVLRGTGEREVHDADADRLLALFGEQPHLLESNWLTALMISRIPRRLTPNPQETK